MKKAFLIPGLFSVAAMTFAFPAGAKPGGCIKGAIVGGIAGHFAGMAESEQPPDVLMASTSGSPTIAKMGTKAAQATNGVVKRSGNSGN
ncbi:MAG: hypothetical protein ACR2KT_08040 [Methylocella sp.]